MRTFLLMLLCVQCVSCVPSLHRNRLVGLSEGATEEDVVNRFGEPDEIYGPMINAYNDSVSIWCYHAKGVWLQESAVWIYLVNRIYAKSTLPGDWPRDSAAIHFTHFRR